MQSELSGEISAFDMGRFELDAFGIVVPTQEPEVQEPYIYRKGGHVTNPEYGCADPTFGNPMPCNVAAALMNHLESIEERLRERYPMASPHHDEEGPELPEQMVFADNRRHDTPGLMRVSRYRGARDGGRYPNVASTKWSG